MGKLFSILLQNEPKNAILHIKTKIIKKNKKFIHIYFFQFQKKILWMKIFLSKKQVNIIFPSSSDTFFFHSIDFFFEKIKKIRG